MDSFNAHLSEPLSIEKHFPAWTTLACLPRRCSKCLCARWATLQSPKVSQQEACWARGKTMSKSLHGKHTVSHPFWASMGLSWLKPKRARKLNSPSDTGQCRPASQGCVLTIQATITILWQEMGWSDQSLSEFVTVSAKCCLWKVEGRLPVFERISVWGQETCACWRLSSWWHPGPRQWPAFTCCRWLSH